MRRALLVGVAVLSAAVACGRSELFVPGGELADDGGAHDAPSGGDDATQPPPGGGDASPPYDGGQHRDGGQPHDGGITDGAPTPSPDAGCGPSTCAAGCCNAQGQCVTPTDQECGFFGEACTSCGANGHCKGGCIYPTANCGPENCAGCCAGPSWCADGIHGVLCGHGGEPCVRCNAVDGTGTCEPDPGGGAGGMCVQPITCGPGNCNGCCYGNVCAQGNQDIACGSGGNMCVVCTNSNGTCINNRCSY